MSSTPKVKRRRSKEELESYDVLGGMGAGKRAAEGGDARPDLRGFLLPSIEAGGGLAGPTNSETGRVR